MSDNLNKKYILPFKSDIESLNLIDKRLSEFNQIHQTTNDQWFQELCFCILTANSQAKKALIIEKKLGIQGFLNASESEIANTIKSVGHRFHNNKAKYIVEARKYKNIKDIVEPLGSFKAREFIVKNIKGLGYKEASHFLRNVGYHDVAIIDRHILKFLAKYNFIDHVPKVVTKKIYLEMEEILVKFRMPLDRLDLLIWHHMTQEVLK